MRGWLSTEAAALLNRGSRCAVARGSPWPSWPPLTRSRKTGRNRNTGKSRKKSRKRTRKRHRKRHRKRTGTFPKEKRKRTGTFPRKRGPGKRTGTFPRDKQEKDRHFSGQQAGKAGKGQALFRTLFRTSRKRTGTFPRFFGQAGKGQALFHARSRKRTGTFPRSGKGQALFGGFAGDVFWSESFLGGSVFGGASRHPTPTLEHAHVIHSRRSRGTGPGDGSRCPARRTARP